MNLVDAAEVVIKKLYLCAGLQIVNGRKGKVIIPSFQGKFMTFFTSDGWGLAPLDNPKDIHWTIHTKRKVPKKTAFLHLLMQLIEAPAEFHEKEKGKVTKKFRWRDGYKPFGKFIEDRRKERKKGT